MPSMLLAWSWLRRRKCLVRCCRTGACKPSAQEAESGIMALGYRRLYPQKQTIKTNSVDYWNAWSFGKSRGESIWGLFSKISTVCVEREGTLWLPTLLRRLVLNARGWQGQLVEACSPCSSAPAAWPASDFHIWPPQKRHMCACECPCRLFPGSSKTISLSSLSMRQFFTCVSLLARAWWAYFSCVLTPNHNSFMWVGWSEWLISTKLPV